MFTTMRRSIFRSYYERQRLLRIGSVASPATRRPRRGRLCTELLPSRPTMNIIMHFLLLHKLGRRCGRLCTPTLFIIATNSIVPLLEMQGKLKYCMFNPLRPAPCGPRPAARGLLLSTNQTSKLTHSTLRASCDLRQSLNQPLKGIIITIVYYIINK